MIHKNHQAQKGIINVWVATTIGLIVLSVAVAIFAVWALINYTDQKTNVDSKINDAVVTAKKDQVDVDEAKFTEREKEPMRQFTGPSDYGGVTFNYPKTWSAFVNKDAASGGTYEAYLNPVVVPPISSTQQFAIRVLIEEKDYDKAVTGYDAQVKKGDLKSSAFSVDGSNGTRLDGSFSKDIRGAAVLFKIRDKTLTIRTDANTFMADFNALIATIKFNQ